MSEELLRGVVNASMHLLAPGWTGDPLTDAEVGFLLNIRAQAHQFLGETEEAIKYFQESIRTSPSQPRWYLNRALFWDYNGRSDLASTDRLKAEQLRRDIRETRCRWYFPAPGF